MIGDPPSCVISVIKATLYWSNVNLILEIFYLVLHTKKCLNNCKTKKKLSIFHSMSIPSLASYTLYFFPQWQNVFKMTIPFTFQIVIINELKLFFLFILNNSLELGPLEGDFKSCGKCVACLGPSKSSPDPISISHPLLSGFLCWQVRDQRGGILSYWAQVAGSRGVCRRFWFKVLCHPGFLSTSPSENKQQKYQKPNFGKHSYLAFRKSKLNTSTTEGMNDILVIHL